MTASKGGSAPPSRAPYAAALAVVVVLGLLSRRLPLGTPLWDEWLGDGLYAAAAYLALGVLRPHTAPHALALAALAWCFGVELFQLTGIPERLSGMLLARLLLGTTFAVQDLFCYAAGVLGSLMIDTWSRGRRTPGC